MWSLLLVAQRQCFRFAINHLRLLQQLFFFSLVVVFVIVLALIWLYYVIVREFDKHMLRMKQINTGLQSLCQHAQNLSGVIKPAAMKVEKMIIAAHAVGSALTGAQEEEGVASAVAGPGRRASPRPQILVPRWLGIFRGGVKWMPLFGKEAKQKKARVAKKGCCYCCWCGSAQLQSSDSDSSSSSSSDNTSDIKSSSN
jgi:hypothetical protein